MKIAYSPCPNDTFVFHALTHGLIEGAPSFGVTYADIDVTNHLAINGDPDKHDVLKISFAALPWVLEDYTLLSCGGALGRGCGPLVLTANDENNPNDLEGKRVAVPSERSTAYLLFRLWTAQQVEGNIGDVVVMPFHEIMPAVQNGDVDAGLVIHEARFTYQNYGLNKLVDLGDWWEKDTGYAIPLGAIIARRSVDREALTGWIKQSVDYAWERPEASKEYVRFHAQEMDEEVAQNHIDLYVNGFTKELGEEGYGAVEAFLGRAAKEGLVPGHQLQRLRDR
ncbi:1,4-dihydroxy-6-naphthoate synthase [Salicibibacter halophilus]|uniref:1,4-dihydroxy-6-naphtoate synthase n=1 Tax=Salicibibacter halophilus TaxID=2502791 RepID=A0A514LLJ8_9BACI|nr:1,4-dihydroxy-6-naphthoate synthase [Salicibibacter halophilus]QDI92405.1 1,4-dihydroxy-6-naphthoate synthase [Salicibibacter halophilus]